MTHPQRTITLRFLAEPTDVNYGGKVHGGAVMRWIDQAGYACAVGWAHRYCVTVYVGGIRFYRPIATHHLVEITATIVHTGTTSMHISIHVRSADPRDGVFQSTTSCTIVFVAVDDDGKPVPVPPWKPVSAEDQALSDQAVRMMELRKQLEADVEHVNAANPDRAKD